MLMQSATLEFRRILKPTGSVMIVLQPNSEHVGQMRSWLWRYLVWAMDEWNLVQDVYWWNTTAMPTGACKRTAGLMRPSLKYCIWLGDPKCYRNQDAVLWRESDSTKVVRLRDRAQNGREYHPSGYSVNQRKMVKTSVERGGTTPYNVLPIDNNRSRNSAGSHGHGAGTPYELCDWWVRYISKPGDIIFDPFAGTATVGVAALRNGRKFIGIERAPDYVGIASERITSAIHKVRG